MSRSIVHASFTITRHWKASPARVFQAFADQQKKDACWKTGVVSRFDCIYLDIVPNERIIYSYVMHLDDRKISVSQAAIELKPEKDGTSFTLTEYGDYLDGYDDAGSREHGTNFLMDALGKSLTS